jgi:threonine/homoserine/homoserine lactone efflux protein
MTIGHALLAFTIAAGLLTITPGLDTALVLRTAAVEGKGRAIIAAAGICSGLFVWALAVSVGLGALLAVSRIAYNILRLAGACYLIFLGARMLFRHRPGTSGSEPIKQSPHGAGFPSRGTHNWFVRGLLTNLLNPKVGVFYVTFLPQFIPAGVHVTLFSLLLASIHVIEGLLWFAVLISATELLSGWLRRPGVAKTIDRVTGSMLIGFGLALGFEKSR